MAAGDQATHAGSTESEVISFMVDMPDLSVPVPLAETLRRRPGFEDAMDVRWVFFGMRVLSPYAPKVHSLLLCCKPWIGPRTNSDLTESPLLQERVVLNLMQVSGELYWIGRCPQCRTILYGKALVRT